MIRGFARSVVSVVTALSLAVALMTSVFAQSHDENAGAAIESDPCVDHQLPRETSLWDDACASLCETSDFHSFVGVSTERSSGIDQHAMLVSYDALSVGRAGPTSKTDIVLSHDPPGSSLYLTTQRLRI
ncbi:MAG: hypothetical protein GKS03_06235 [Alphaproteobacteria bacterium]|nr:hypothetical protein [Alphaproteobacteria bacterium]